MKVTRPRVSICIPAYNQAEHLKKTIDSVLLQNYTDYEIIITDDSPGTIVHDLVKGYNLANKIKYYKNPSTLGSPENWNQAIRKSTGEYIKILHHDDWLNGNDSLAKYVQLLDNNPRADFGFSATEVIFPGGNKYTHRASASQLSELKNNHLYLYTNNIIGAPSTVIFRKNLKLLFDTRIKWLVDKDYYIRQMEKNKNVAYSPEPLAVTFAAEGRVTDECKDNRQLEVFEFFYLLQKIFRQRKKYTRAFNQCIISAIDICKKYGIKNIAEIRECGYHGSIPKPVSLYLSINNLSQKGGRQFMKVFSKAYD